MIDIKAIRDRAESIRYLSVMVMNKHEVYALCDEIERLQQQVTIYEKHGVTCQTFGHKLTGCAECNRDDAAESVNETNAVLANNYLALVPEIERQQFHISTLETDNAVFKQEIESLREQIGAYQLHEKQLLAAKMGLECKVDRLRADAAAYHALNAELDKQMAAKPDNY